MSQGFWKADPEVWELIIAPYCDGIAPWTTEVRWQDLCWHASRVRLYRWCVENDKPKRGMRQVPGLRTLAQRWNCSKHQAGKLVARLIEEQPDMDRRTLRGQSSDTSRTVVGQSSDSPDKTNADNQPKTGQSSDTSRTVVGQSSDTFRHTRVDVEKRREKREERKDLLPTVASGNPPAGLSDKVRASLLAVGHKTVDDLTKLTRRELLEVPGIGKAAAAQVEALLAKHGRKLRPPPPTAGQKGQPYAKAWHRAWTAERGGRYPDGNFGRIASRLSSHVQTLGTEERAEQAFRAFLRADRNGGEWPKGEPSTVEKFLKKPASWVVKVESNGGRAAQSTGLGAAADLLAEMMSEDEPVDLGEVTIVQ